MPQVGVNDEPLLERLMFGYDGSDYRVVKVDASGNLVAAVLADQNVQARGYGWIGGAWQKQPLPFGVSDHYLETQNNTSLAAGTNTIDYTAVPAGEVWVATNVFMLYSGTVTNVILSFSVYDGATSYDIFSQDTITSTRGYDRQGWWPMKAGDKLRVTVQNATLNNDLYSSAIGFKMDVDQ